MKNSTQRTIGFLLLILSSQANAWTSWIGALEDWPTRDASKPDQQLIYESRVRPLFVRVDEGPWLAAPKAGTPNPVAMLPKAFSWDVCFSGRGEGNVTAVRDDSASDSAVPPYILRESDRAPWRTRRSLDYAGWLAEPVYKPIILSSSMNTSCRDPEKWKAGPGERAKIHLEAMIALTKLELTKIDPKNTLQEGTAKVHRAWGTAKQGRFAVIRSKAVDASEVRATFFIGDGGPEFIGFHTMMIDAGDFDGDGKTDLVFKQRAEKKDVYLLYNGGVKLAENIWDYNDAP